VSPLTRAVQTFLLARARPGAPAGCDPAAGASLPAKARARSRARARMCRPAHGLRGWSRSGEQRANRTQQPAARGRLRRGSRVCPRSVEPLGAPRGLGCTDSVSALRGRACMAAAAGRSRPTLPCARAGGGAPGAVRAAGDHGGHRPASDASAAGVPHGAPGHATHGALAVARRVGRGGRPAAALPVAGSSDRAGRAGTLLQRGVCARGGNHAGGRGGALQGVAPRGKRPASAMSSV